MVAEEVGPATTDSIIQLLAHVIGIVGNGQLYVILLPVERGMDIDPLLLMLSFCYFIISYRAELFLFLAIHKSVPI